MFKSQDMGRVHQCHLRTRTGRHVPCEYTHYTHNGHAGVIDWQSVDRKAAPIGQKRSINSRRRRSLQSAHSTYSQPRVTTIAVQLPGQSLQLQTRSSARAEGPLDALVRIEKSFQSMNDLDIGLHPGLSQLLLNGRTAYHFLFAHCCFNVFI